LHELFEAQAQKKQDVVAVVYEGVRLTYGELNQKANHLAHRLRALGAGPEKLVGICMERSLEMVVGILGILKAGAAYVPLDPAYPRERLGYMAADAGFEVLLTQERFRHKVPFDGEVLVWEQDESSWHKRVERISRWD
jgi:non-ribosomal peptide synthetase component F